MPLVQASEIVEIKKWATTYGTPTPIEQIIMGSSYVPIDKAQNYTVITGEQKHNGDYSMKICYPKPAQKSTNMQLKNTYLSDITDGVYTISFYLKGDYSKDGVLVGIGGNKNEENGSLLYLSNSRFEETKDGEWTKYSVVVNYKTDAYKFFSVITEKDSPEFYIDDISVKNEQSEEMLENGDFEDVNVTRVFEDIPYDSKKPRNPLCVQSGSIIDVSWENAEAAGIEKVSLYDITDTKKLITDEISIASGGIVNIDYTVSNANIDNVFEIITEFDDDTKSSFSFSKLATASNVDIVSPWSSYFTNYAAQPHNIPVDVIIDSSQAYEGKGSCKIISHQNDILSNYYYRFETDIDLELGKTYRLSMQVRSRKANRVPVRYSWFDFKGYNGSNIIYSSGETFDWTEVQKEITVTEDMTQKKLMFIIEESNKELWIDDIQIHLLENGTEVGENLFTNGGFEENSDTYTAGEVTNVNTSAGDSVVNITWKKPNTYNFRKVRLYDVTDGKTSLVGEYSTESAIAAFLENEKEHTFVLKTVSKQNVESKGVTFKCIPKKPDVAISEIEVKCDGKVAEVLSPGTYSVETSIANNKSETPVNAALIAVLYKGNELVYIEKCQSEVGKGETKNLSITDITVPDINGVEYKMEFHLWDDIYSMNRLKEKKVLKQELN